ncbi:DciA family protein [Streptomyces sp. NPDC056652]|uniref:DciA family protein n=1 Tax=Streptomyces sp. NPDC056652 TaxID=3345893 RepID=UPI003692E02E
MTDQQTASGADLARQALAAYRTTANTRPGAGKQTRRTRSRRGADGRDPVGFGTVLASLNANQDWRLSLDGGSILDQWASLCPQYADTIQPIAYDPDRGRLDLKPSTHAYAAQLRLLGGQLAKQINDKVGRDVVRSIRVLPVGAVSPTAPAREPGRPASAPAPVRTRDTASPGYQRTLQTHLQHKREPGPTNPLIREAIARSDRILAHPSRREPETAFTDAIAAAEQAAAQAAAGQPVDSLDASLRAARARAERERAGGTQPVRRLFETV